MSHDFLRQLETMDTPSILTEGLVGVEVLMIIDEVCKARKFTNPVQIFMFAKLVAALKDGHVTTVPDLSSAPTTNTPAKSINAIRSLTDDETAALADYLKDVFSYRNKEYIWPTHCVDRDISTADWIIKYVILSREDSRD